MIFFVSHINNDVNYVRNLQSCKEKRFLRDTNYISTDESLYFCRFVTIIMVEYENVRKRKQHILS